MLSPKRIYHHGRNSKSIWNGAQKCCWAMGYYCPRDDKHKTVLQDP